MSVWCEVKGSVICRKDAHVSIKKLFIDACDECSVSVDTKVFGVDKYFHIVDYNFCAEGMEAAKVMEAVVEAIKNRDINARIDLESSIRWF